MVVETVFTIPGLGQAAYQAVLQRDFNALLGIIFLCSLLVVVVNLIPDIVYAKLDARIEL